MTSDLQLNTASADADPLDEPGLRETADPTPMYRRDPWRRRYRRNLALTDLFSLVWVVYGTQLLWFGLGNAQVAAGRDSRISDLSYWVFSAILIVTWMWALSFVDSRSDRVIGTGSAEYVRIADASFRLFGTVAIIAFLTQIDVARGYLLISLPLGILVLIFTRWMWRQWLVVQRSRGLYSANVLLVGSLPSVTQLAREFGRSPAPATASSAPACRTARSPTSSPAPPSRHGSRGRRHPSAAGHGCRHGRDHQRRRPAGRQGQADLLEPRSRSAAPRARAEHHRHRRPAPAHPPGCRPPLIHVETPKFSRGQSFLKRSVDLFAASVA